jgi:hypothetical protein
VKLVVKETAPTALVLIVIVLTVIAKKTIGETKELRLIIRMDR